MKKKNFFMLCLIGLSFLTLSSCKSSTNPNENITDYGYSKNVVDGFYSYTAKFENGMNKTYKLNKDITAKVDGNTLILAKKYERYIIDIDNNSITLFDVQAQWWKDNGIYKSVPSINKKIVEVTDGTIDRWIKENMSEDIIPDYTFNNEKYSYRLMPYKFYDGEWDMNYYNSESYSYEYDSNGNEIFYSKGYYKLENGWIDEFKYEKSYNEKNQITKQAKYFLNASGEYEFSGYLVYSYDSKGNFIKKECNKILNEYTYDENNNLIRSYEYSKQTQNATAVEYTYDSNNNITCIKKFKKNSEQDELKLETKQTFTYDENNHVILETMEYARYLDESKLTWMCWVCSTPYNYRIEYKYEGDKLVYDSTIYYYFDLNDYTSETKQYYTEDGMKIITSVPDGDTETTIYDKNNNILSYSRTYTYNDKMVGESTDYTYDENGNLISSVSYHLEKSDSSIIENKTITLKEEMSYDKNNNLLTQKKYNYSNHKGSVKEYSYDENGFLKKETTYVTSDYKPWVLTYEFEIACEGKEYEVVTSKIYDNDSFIQLMN